jgi:tetratricopeptide (TPR) repeat protein
MTKYRIRLANGRVIGPFEKVQLFELKAKGRIVGNEEAQVYPMGDWAPLSKLDIFDELMDENRTVLSRDTTEHTFIIDLDKLRKKQAEADLEALEDEGPPPVVENLTETVRLESPDPVPRVSLSDLTATGASIDKLDSGLFELDEGFTAEHSAIGDKTVINPVAQEELERMRRLKKEREAEEQSEEERRKQEDALAAIRRAEDEARALEPVDDSTQMLDLNVIDNKKELLARASKQEKVLKREIRKIKEKKRAEEGDDDEEEDASPKKTNFIRILILVGAVLAVTAYLFPDNGKPKPKPFVNIPPQIQFPIPFDKADSRAAKVHLGKAVEEFNKGTYPGLLKSGLYFKAAYENDLSNELPLNMMVRVYAEELLLNRADPTQAQTLFNLIQTKKPFLQQDPNGVFGMNLFFMSIKKYAAAADVIAKYLKVRPKNTTQELYAAYIQSLIAVGNLDLARDFFKGLDKAPNKNRYAYVALIDYLLLNQELQKAEEYVDKAIFNYPQLVKFYLYKADLSLRKNKVDQLPALLSKVMERGVENNQRYYAEFLEYSGLYWAAKGNVKKGAAFLRKSLQIENSPSLRVKLADLNASGNSEASTLITESQAAKHLYQAQTFFDKKSYQLALSSIAKASDLVPGNIQVEAYLAKVQFKLGLIQQGLKTLEDLVKKYPEDKVANFTLIQAYIDNYKFNDARNLIAIISSTELREGYEYASKNARLFLKMGDSQKAISWLQASMKANPLNDEDIFLLAEVLLKRANFKAATDMLNKCIELDPVNPDYRIAYSRVVYETEDDQAAIGYLLGLLDEFGENPKILSEIAVFYYRVGKVKDFLVYKERLTKLPTRDKALYEFLIKAALLDERYDEIPELVEELIRIEPGDIDAMMTAGKVLFETGKLEKAAHWFKRVRDKLSSYPKVLYYSARIRLLNRDYEGAMQEIKQDLKDNGESDLSLVLLGEIYVEKNDLITAENTYKKAQKINPSSFEALIGLADLSTKRNNYDLALDLYKRAMKQNSEEPTVHKKIGDVYRLLGQGALAIESYKLYLDMKPEALDKKQIESYIQLMQ